MANVNAKAAIRKYKQEVKSYNRKRFKKNWTGYLFILPFILLFTTFIIFPVAISIFFGFTYYNILQPAKFIGFDNYINLFLNDDIFILSIKNTFVFAAVTGPIGYVASFIFAWLINELRPKVRAVMVLIFYAPSISGAVYMIWSFMFSGDAYGFVNSTLMKYGFIYEPKQWLTDVKLMMPVIMIVVVWMSLGAGFLSFVAGLQGLDVSQFEAGLVDGIRNRWQELWFITLPQMKPQLMFGAVMSITSSFSIGDVTQQLAGFPSTDYAVHTILNHLTDYGWVRFEMGYASAIATLLFLAMIVTNQVIQSLLRKVGR